MQHKTILYVEDDPNDVLLVERAFRVEAVDHAIRVARDGEEAIAYLAGAGQFADRMKYPLPRLVLLDVKIPKRDGFEVLQWIRADQALKALPVIMFSSAHLDSDVTKAYQLGANCFVVKPFDYDELREIVRFLRDWLVHSRLAPEQERAWVALTAREMQARWGHY